MALIFALSAVPGDLYPRIDIPDADKGVHAILFLPLGWLVARALRPAGQSGDAGFPTRADILSVAVGALYGLSDEIHQIWVPSRTFSLFDLAVDALAVTAGVAAWSIAARMAALPSAQHPALTRGAPAPTKTTATPEDQDADHPRA